MSPNRVAPEPGIPLFSERESRSTADSPLSGQRHQPAPLTLITSWSKSPVFHLKCEQKTCSGCTFICGGEEGQGAKAEQGGNSKIMESFTVFSFPLWSLPPCSVLASLPDSLPLFS